ncbi:hypothetical protein IE077_000580 [Cardiosporidium cionae]|uniref:Uncharacterized protein n=1 Tax=Cardiosporidium cionae TaxID=476202 RepID=A0ABQ7J7S2_9APIC|nr:hypothetical protein IE077_000580 [Cardiosporidium cionae]|eukprot:KAF8820032.1 hypothetical protein IE077_000580 [Cardiosporidium cionae]
MLWRCLRKTSSIESIFPIVNRGPFRKCMPIRNTSCPMHYCFSSASSETSPPGDMIEEQNGRREYNPILLGPHRPSQYRPRIVNSVLHPLPGTPISSMRYIWMVAVFGFGFSCIQSFYEINKYYHEHGHRYENGWNVFHYHHKKGTLYE